MLDSLKVKYNINPSDRGKEIIRLKKKYNLYTEEKAIYNFKPNELEMVIKQKNSPSYLFFPNQPDSRYELQINGMLGNGEGGNLELTYLYNLGNKLSENIQKPILAFFKRVEICKKKMLEQLPKIDYEEKSEKLTEIYIDQMSDSIQKIIELSMIKKECEWKKIGEILKLYLSKLGFFVPKDIEDSIKSDYISIKLSHPKSTIDKAMHGKIDFFNNLPYCVYYYDADEENPEIRAIEGICTYYKYKE